MERVFYCRVDMGYIGKMAIESDCIANGVTLDEFKTNMVKAYNSLRLGRGVERVLVMEDFEFIAVKNF